MGDKQVGLSTTAELLPFRRWRRRGRLVRLALATQCSTVKRKAALFYCVELFEDCKLVGIAFFEVGEFHEARQSASTRFRPAQPGPRGSPMTRAGSCSAGKPRSCLSL